MPSTPQIPTSHKIIIGRADTVLSSLEPNSLQFAVTSPPYPMIKQWDDLFCSLDQDISWHFKLLENAREKNDRLVIANGIYEEMHVQLKRVWHALVRVIEPGGIICIVMGDALRSFGPGTFRIYPNHATTIEFFRNIRCDPLTYILWKKPTNKPNAFLGSGFHPPNAYVTLDVEYILLFRKGRGTPRRFKRKDPSRELSKYTKEERDRWFSQIWDIKGVKQNIPGIKKRTAAFPEELPRRLIRMFSVIGDTGVDPFAGTGTTGKVAKELGRGCINIDIDPVLEEVMKERIGT